MDISFWTNYKQNYYAIKARHDYAKTQVDWLSQQKSQFETTVAELVETLSLARKCLETSVERKDFIERIVTLGLQAIYGTSIEFILQEQYEKEILKGLKLVCKTPKGFTDDIEDSFGGGAQAVTSMLITICACAFSGQRFIAFDEPVSQLPEYRWLRLEEILLQIAQQLGLQIFIITHARPMGKTYWIEMDKDEISHARVASQEEIKELKDNLYEEDTL